MVSYRLDGVAHSQTATTSRYRIPAATTVSEFISNSELMTNEYQHPVAVFNAAGQPIFRNAVLADRLAADSPPALTDSPWQLAWATTCRIAGEAVANRSAISTVISVQRHSFAVLGSLLRQPTGSIMGTIVHLADVTASVVSGDRRPDTSGQPDVDGQREDVDAWHLWVTRRNEARTRIQRLSPRESEVIAHVSTGMPNKSIARKLEISVKTIEKHRANAVRKLGVTSTPEMVRIVVLADNRTGSPQTAADSSAI